MKRLALIACIFATCLEGQRLRDSGPAQPTVIGPMSIAFNFPTIKLAGTTKDAQFWGYKGSETFSDAFLDVPSGYRVRILEIQGNYMAGSVGDIPAGQKVYASWGLKTTAPDGSKHSRLGADNCFVYLQYALSHAIDVVNQPFKLTTKDAGLLEPDATYTVVLAVFLEDSQVPIHMEVTGTMTFQYEKVGN